MIVIKLGGATLQDISVIRSVADDISELGSSVPMTIVHGGGPAINEELSRRGISWSFHEGQRITTPEMMDGIEAALCGQVTRRIVRELVKRNVPAVGFSGVDARTLVCDRADAKLGEVGVVKFVDTRVIDSLLAQKLFPVMAPVGVDADGCPLNVNADWAAASVAIALRAQRLIFLTDQEGILDSEKKLISRASSQDLQQLIETKVVQGGMLAKTRTILHSLSSGVEAITIASAQRPRALLSLVRGEILGTTCFLRQPGAGSSK